MIFHTLSLIGFAAILTSCGGLNYYVHDNVPPLRGESLAPVTLNTGQTIRVLKHSSGLMWGGYTEGLTIEDSSIVSIRYGRIRSNATSSDESDTWAPHLSIKGNKPGTTRAVYCNRLGEQPDFSKPLPKDFQSRSFQIIVK